MRIEFASGAHGPVAWLDGVLRIGRAVDNDVCLDGDGVAAHHARLIRDQRGLVLEVERAAGHVYVNARPVRERALLRAGDIVGMGGHRLRLCADDLPDADASAAGGNDSMETATMALRAVAGPCSGRVWALAGRLQLDAQGPTTVSRGAAAVLQADGQHVRMNAAALDAAVSVRVNGVTSRRARMADGDQLAIGAHRFVLDISARSMPLSAITHVLPAESSSDRSQGLRHQMGWLIATAVVLAVVLALALLVRF